MPPSSRNPASDPPRPGRLGEWLIAAAACLVGLALAEAAVRLSGATPKVGFLRKDQFQLSPNVKIGWEPIPNPASTGDTLSPRWSPEERNSLGFRDYEHTVAKVPGVYRILVLGDSIAKGLGIPDPRMAFPMVMETTLREMGVPNEVLNFGVEGYNTQQEVETLKDKGLAYAPDLVILAYCLNDRTWPAHELYARLLEEESRTGTIGAARVAPWLRHSALWLFLRYRVLDAWILKRGVTEARNQELIDLVQRDTVEEYFTVLADLARRHGFRVLVAVFPYIDDLVDYKYFDQDRWAQEQSARNGFMHVDLMYPFLECQRRSGRTIAFDDVHPNNLGHVCAGRALAAFLKDRIAVSGSPR